MADEIRPELRLTEGETVLPADCCAVVFKPDGSFELWLPKAKNEDDEMTEGAIFASALAINARAVDTFLPTCVAHMEAIMRAAGADFLD